jgi:hypothetical protein
MTVDVHPKQCGTEFACCVACGRVTRHDLLRAALAYAANGRPVFPCYPWCGYLRNKDGKPVKAKAPIGSLVPNGKDDATLDLDLITKWWIEHPWAMIGSPVAVDELCLDIDPRNGGDRWALQDLLGIELPPTRMVLSGRYDGGHHLFFKRPEGQRVATRLPGGIDLKDGGKGYTILPPSIHPDTGGLYLWRHENVPAAPLPDAVDKLLIPLNQERVQGEYTPTGDAASEFLNSGNKRSAKALAALLRLVGTAEEGERNKKLYWAGRRIAENGYPESAWAHLREAGFDCGLPQNEIAATIKSAKAGPKNGR